MMEIKKFVQCRNCPRIENSGPAPGYYYKTENGLKVSVECDCHKKWREEKELMIKCESSHITTDYTFDDYRGKASEYELRCLKEYAYNFEKFKYGTMVYVYGGSGTQKTSMVQYAGKVLLKKGYKVHYIKMNDLLTYLISNKENNYNPSENIENIQYELKRCNDCDLLIIDESFDPSKIFVYKSGYQMPFLDSFLRNRFELNKKPIIFISEVKPSDIEKYGYSHSLKDFVERNTKTSFLEFRDNYERNANMNLGPTDLFGVKR